MQRTSITLSICFLATLTGASLVQANEKVRAFENCDKLSGLSTAFVEEFSRRFKTSASAIYIVSKQIDAEAKACYFSVNSSSGVKKCSDYEFIKLDNGKIIAHLYAGLNTIACGM